MSRLIDADEVIKFYANFINEHGFDLKDARFSIRDIEMNLWNIPTVEPTASEWIPVSEGLPLNLVLVLVTYIDEDVDYPTVDMGYYTSRGFYDRDFNIIDDVLAWQPLPKPYEVKE